MLKFVFCRKVFPTNLSSSSSYSYSPLLETITGRASGFCPKAFFNTVAARGTDYVVRSPPPGRGLDDCSTVPVIPRPYEPMLVGHFDGYYDVKDPLFSALLERYRVGSPYVCVSLLKNCCPETDYGLTTTDFVPKNCMPRVKGKELFHRLHKVGTLCKIKHFWGDNIFLTGLRRVRLTEMVNYDAVSGGLLTVKVDHLKDLPFNKDDAKIKYTATALRLALEKYGLDRKHWEVINECDCQQLSDYVFDYVFRFADLDAAPVIECQEFLEELDVHKRLQLMLELVEWLIEDTKYERCI